MTIIFLIACVTLVPFGLYSGLSFSVTVIVALLVCLIPTTIGGLLSAIGIAGMDRLIRHNVIPMSGRAVEAAGDVDTMLLDKTGTITLGNRMATEFIAAPGVRVEELADAAQLASLADETPEGRSIVVLAKERHGLRGRELRPRLASASRSPRGPAPAARTTDPDLRPVLGPDAHERLRPRRPRDPQGRGGGDRRTWRRSAAACRSSGAGGDHDRAVGRHAARGVRRAARARASST